MHLSHQDAVEWNVWVPANTIHILQLAACQLLNFVGLPVFLKDVSLNGGEDRENVTGSQSWSSEGGKRRVIQNLTNNRCVHKNTSVKLMLPYGQLFAKLNFYGLRTIQKETNGMKEKQFCTAACVFFMFGMFEHMRMV